MFQVKFIKEEYKANLTLNNFEKLKLDVIFVQEATDKLIAEIYKQTSIFRVVHKDLSTSKDMNKNIILINMDTLFLKGKLYT